MRVITVCILTVLSTLQPAFAQEAVAWERFFPGEEDDFWRFEEQFTFCYGYEDPICETTSSRHTYRATERVQTDTSITMVVQSGQSRCRVSIAEGDAWFAVEQVEGERCLPLMYPSSIIDFPQDEPAEPVVVSVNGFSYTVAALKGAGSHHFAADLGLYTYYAQAWNGEQQFMSYYRLVEAQVGGVHYGVPVAAEPDATDAPVRLDVYPNPFRDRLVLRLEGSRTAASPFVSVEVFDLLGRRVRAEEVSATDVTVVDLASLAPGTYVIRAVGADGTALTRRATKLR